MPAGPLAGIVVFAGISIARRFFVQTPLTNSVQSGLRQSQNCIMLLITMVWDSGARHGSRASYRCRRSGGYIFIVQRCAFPADLVLAGAAHFGIGPEVARSRRGICHARAEQSLAPGRRRVHGQSVGIPGTALQRVRDLPAAGAAIHLRAGFRQRPADLREHADQGDAPDRHHRDAGDADAGHRADRTEGGAYRSVFLLRHRRGHPGARVLRR